MQGEEGTLVVRGLVEIDTRRPFRSVREAVMLFGEKVLAGEICVSKLKEMQTKASNGQSYSNSFNIGAINSELEETKQHLQKAKEEKNVMARSLTFVRHELEQTKRELHQLKSIKEISQISDKPDIEGMKFVENNTNVEITNTSPGNNNNNHDGFEILEKKRYVKFADTPLLTRVISNGDQEVEQMVSNKKKPKKKTVFGRLFLKKGNNC